MAIVVGLRLHRPASRRPVVAASPLGFALFWLGDLYTYSYPRLLGEEVPFPSLGDARLRRGLPGADGGPADARPPPQPASRDRAGVIDSLIITLGLALLSWVVPDRARTCTTPS